MEKYFEYLNKLRDSGATNMYGAVPFLQQKFPELGFDRARAQEVLRAWISSFDDKGDTKK